MDIKPMFGRVIVQLAKKDKPHSIQLLPDIPNRGTIVAVAYNVEALVIGDEVFFSPGAIMPLYHGENDLVLMNAKDVCAKMLKKPSATDNYQEDDDRPF